MPVRSPLSQRAAFSRALDLYDELFAHLQDVTGDLYSDTYRSGRASIAALRDIAADGPLSDEVDELLEGYLQGPDPDDIEALEVWMRMFPELLVDLRREEESRHTASVVAAPSVRAEAFDHKLSERVVLDIAEAIETAYFRWSAVEFVRSARYYFESPAPRESSDRSAEPNASYADAA